MNTENCDAFNINSFPTIANSRTQNITSSKKYANVNNAKDKLYLLKPGFTDSRLGSIDQVYFCPFNAMMEGVLRYFPELHHHLEITYIDFPRPRRQIVDLVGEENQGLPLLVIKNKSVENNHFKKFNETSFISGIENILNYLSVVYKIPLPHP